MYFQSEPSTRLYAFINQFIMQKNESVRKHEWSGGYSSFSRPLKKMNGKYLKGDKYMKRLSMKKQRQIIKTNYREKIFCV